MLLKSIYLLCLLFFNSLSYLKCFNVNFHYLDQINVIENDETPINKRDMTQFFDQASFSFNGFERIESVPVMFPLDICIIKLENLKYAISLHKNLNGENSLAIFKANNGSYELVKEYSLSNAITMDCKAIGSSGYIAVTRNLTDNIRNAREGSPIFEISNDRIRAVQYFATTNLRSAFLRVSGNELFLLQTFQHSEGSPNLNCPYFKWSGTTFDKLGGIPCSNARNLEPFSINYESYVAIANYADQYGRTNVYSEIYKFNPKNQKFQLFQKIKTNGAVDVRHFRVPFNIVGKKHFLVFGNSLSNRQPEKPGSHLEADSVFYVFEKGQFVPYQSISLYAVEKFLPIENVDAEKFLLLVACANQDIKIYNLNDWKFEVSNVQYTEGALGKGVAKMRIFEENDNSYLIIANENMADNETNIFLPIFKQEEHANALRQEIMDWAKENMERLEQIDVEQLKTEVEKKLNKYKGKAVKDITDIPEAHIKTVLTKSLIYPRYHLNSHYWLALKYLKQALDALEEIYALRQPRDLQKFTKEASIYDKTMEFTHKTLKVKKFKVGEKLKAKKINGIDLDNPKFEHIKAKKIMVSGYYSEPKQRLSSEQIKIEQNLNIKNLQLKGKINGFEWTELVNNTLKKEGVQFIKGSSMFKDLKAETVMVTKNEISGHDLGKLVSISDGNFVINQDVQFAAPVKAKNVIINNRLNNIHVFNKKFDVLLKHSNETQIIEGLKYLDNLTVLEPITLSGKVAGQHLRSMLPIKAIHEPLILNGNYTIENDATIVKVLNASDIILMKEKSSLLETLHNGLHLEDLLDNISLKFISPLKANNSFISFINGVDMQELIRTNVQEVQVIEGEKIFPNSLEIKKGFAEIKNLNGINIEDLEKNLLLKDTNQTIKVPMHFGRVIAKGVSSANITLSGKPLEKFLSRSKNQQIKGVMKVEKLKTKHLVASNINTNGKILGQNLQDIYQQKAKNTPHHDIFKQGQKFHGSIYVQNVYINSSINGRSIQEIERQLAQLNGNIKYVGNFVFNYPMNVSNLTFEGSLNGLSVKDFGNCWLQKHGNQSFSAPQTLAGIRAEKGTILKGKLNSLDLQDFQTKTFSLEKSEHLDRVVFLNPIEIQGSLTTQSLNELLIPEDILVRNSHMPQSLMNSINVTGHVNINGSLKNVSILNGFNLITLESFLNGQGYDTLHMENANFSFPPTYHTLNHHDLKQCLNEVWLTNENVNLNQHVTIAEADFEGLIDFSGPINNMDLLYLKNNYLSLTIPQEISTELVFLNEVIFQDNINVKTVNLFGPIIESDSKTKFEFNEFVENTLKTSGIHRISGNWSINQALIQGDLHNIQVNSLNLATDILRNDVPLTEVKGIKHLKQAFIKKLYVTPESKVGNVNLSKWMKETVYLYDNKTIYGNTTIDIINLFNDIALKKINNVMVNPNTLMQLDKDQQLEGNLIVENYIPSEKRFLTSNFEDLHVESINNQPILDLLRNIAIKNKTLNLKGPLKFENPISVGTFQGNQDLIAFKKMRRSSNQALNLDENVNDPIFILDHFEIVDVPLPQHGEIWAFTFNKKGTIFIVLNFNSNSTRILMQWSWKDAKFETVQGSYDFFKNRLDSLTEELNVHNESKVTENIASSINGKEDQYLENYNFLQIKGQDCLVRLEKKASSIDFYCFEETKNSSGSHFVLYGKIHSKGVKKIIPLEMDRVSFLYEDRIELWDCDKLQKIKKIETKHIPKDLKYISHRNREYLAIILAQAENVSNHVSVEVYCSSSETSNFIKIQSIPFQISAKLAFSQNEFTDDLFLHFIYEQDDKQLYDIYEYRGSMGFILLSNTVLEGPLIKEIHSLTVNEGLQSLIVLVGDSRFVFVRSIYKYI